MPSRQRYISAFLPGIIILAIGWLPAIAMETLQKVFRWDLEGEGMGWLMHVTIPSLLLGCLAFIGGLIALFISPKKGK